MNHPLRNRLIALLVGACALCISPAAARTTGQSEVRPAGEIERPKEAEPGKTAAGDAGKRPVGEIECPKEAEPGKTAVGDAGKRPVGGAETILPQAAKGSPRFLHRLDAEFRPEYIFPTNPFLKGENRAGLPIDLALSGHFRYAFRFRPGSTPDRIYGSAYQGLGFAYYDFQRPDQVGNPVVFYLFQGARIARLSPRLSFDYEWNFGLSFGWKPYDPETNADNRMMGSKINAYLNVNFLLRWQLMPRVNLTTGVTLTHFSNGNTKYPNAGLNSIGGRIGLSYEFGRPDPATGPQLAPPPAFPRHVSYDLVLFGSWRRKGIEIGDRQYAAPDAYTVVGFNFAPMYNFGYKFRAGVSLDGVYDGSANVIPADEITEIGSSYEIKTVNPGFARQIALGLSARAEFVMPYFNIGIGLGVNVLHKGGDLRSFYQILALKVAVTHNSFLHIGYSLRDFHMPNFLMLGVGYRFNNKYPRHR